MIFLIYSPVTDIHSATEKETPMPFLTLPQNGFSGRYENVLEGPLAFLRVV